jgi:hypothetical protein
MTFKKFTDIKHYTQKRNNVTLRSTGYIFIPVQIMRDILSVNPILAIVFIDEEEMRVGLDFSNITENEEIAIKVNKDKTGYNLNLNPVLNYFNFKRPAKRISFSPIVDNSMLVISLGALSEK